jgi:DNA-binding SARP family transcriptional activator/TolB-like protein
MHVYLRLLGGARIDAAGTFARGRAAQRRRIALLALLAVTPGNRLTRERIVAFLWPNRDSESGRRLLSESLHVIRRTFGDETIRSIGDEVLLDVAAAGSDVADFRRAVTEQRFEDAVRLYSGPFLDGWFVPGTPELEEWVERERARLAASFVSALEALAIDAEDRADWGLAVSYWQRYVELAPDLGRVVRRLALALRSVDDRAAALRVIADHVRHMEGEEFPIDGEVFDLAEQLRGGRPNAPIPVRAETPLLEAAAIDVPNAAPPSMPNDVSLRRDRRLRQWIAVTSTALAALALGVLAIGRPHATRAEVNAPLDATRIAVLYFTHHPADSVGYVADGLTERLIDALGSVSALHVVSKTGVKYFRDLPHAAPLDSVTAMLRVGTLVEGSVQRAGQHIRVSVSLVDASQKTTVASRVLERPVGPQSLFRLQDEISMEVATFLRQRLGEEIRLTASRMGTASAEAQELNDRAAFFRNTADKLRRHGTVDDRPTAIRLLRSADSLLVLAEARDPKWRMATIARGWVASDMARLATDDDSVAAEYRRAARLAQHVLSMDSNNPRALELRGAALWQLTVFAPQRGDSVDVERALADLRRALALDSSRVIAAAKLSQLLRLRARSRDHMNEAIQFARLAYEQDAFLANAEDAVSQLYRATLSMGFIDSAKVWCTRGRRMAADDWRFVECELALMRLDLRHADPGRARDIVAQLARLDPPAKAIADDRSYSPFYRRLVFAAVLGASGARDSARAELARVLHEVQDDQTLRLDAKHDETLVRLAIGDVSGATAALDVYLRANSRYSGAVLNDRAFRQFGLDSTRLADALRSTSAGRY